MTEEQKAEHAVLTHKWGCSDITPEQITRLEELDSISNNTMTTDTPSSRDEEIPTPILLAQLKEEIEQLDKEATASPWFHTSIKGGWDGVTDLAGRELLGVLLNHPANARWTAYARTALPELLKLTVRLSAEREKEREELLNMASSDVAYQNSFVVQLKATLTERDKELAEAYIAGLDLQKEANSLRAQLLAAQTELASIPARVESDEIVCDRCGESCGRVNLPVPRTSTPTDPTLLDEVKREKEDALKLCDELLEMVEEYHNCKWEDEPFTPDIDGLAKRISRLRQSTRETEREGL